MPLPLSKPSRKLLSEVMLFRGLDAAQVDEVAGAAKVKSKSANQSYFRQGQEARWNYVLNRGRIKVLQTTPEGHQVVARFAGAGELFGCVPLYGGTRYPGSAIAITSCEAWAWDKAAMDRLIVLFPRIALNALEFLGAELGHIRSRFQELATERVEQRIARALLRLASQGGKKVEGGVQIAFPLSRQDLAELTGTTLHTVSRILSGWQQTGLVESGRRRIMIKHPHGLVSIAEDLKSGPSLIP